MEWQILIIGGGTLIAFVSVFVKISYKVGSEFTSLKDAINTLTETMKSLKNSLDKMDSKNEQDHEKIFEQLNNHDRRLENIERGE